MEARDLPFTLLGQGGLPSKILLQGLELIPMYAQPLLVLLQVTAKNTTLLLLHLHGGHQITLGHDYIIQLDLGCAHGLLVPCVGFRGLSKVTAEGVGLFGSYRNRKANSRTKASQSCDRHKHTRIVVSLTNCTITKVLKAVNIPMLGIKLLL